MLVAFPEHWVMLTFVQPCGRHPALNDVRELRVKPGDSSVVHSFSMQLGIWSGLGAVDLFQQAGLVLFVAFMRRLYTYRYTVTTRMTPELRWAVIKAHNINHCIFISK